MMANKTDEYYFRDFLNPKKGTALIEAEFSAYPATDSQDSSFDASLTLKDCYRQCNIEFWCNDEEEKLERIEKINKIIREATILRDKMMAFTFEKAKKSKSKKKRKLPENIKDALNL